MVAANRNDNWAPGINLILGVWLFISAFVWPHTTAAMTNTWILGVIIAVISAISLSVPQVRWLDALAAVWLFISTFAISHQNVGTVWNYVVIAVVVFILCLVGEGVYTRTPTVTTTRRINPV